MEYICLGYQRKRLWYTVIFLLYNETDNLEVVLNQYQWIICHIPRHRFLKAIEKGYKNIHFSYNHKV